jgi:hypothetical protein
VDFVLKHFIHDEAEVRALGTIAVEILPFVFQPGNILFKKFLCTLDLLTDLGQVSDFHRGAELFNQVHDADAMKIEFIVLL